MLSYYNIPEEIEDIIIDCYKRKMMEREREKRIEKLNRARLYKKINGKIKEKKTR